MQNEGYYEVMAMRDRIIHRIRWTEKYTKTDMVYLAKGGSWLILEQISGVTLSLTVAIVFGHLAGKDTYGNYKYVLALASVLGAVSLSGLGDAVSQAVAKGKDGALMQGFRTNLVWSGPFVLASLSVAAYYAMHGNPFVAGSLMIVAFVQPVAASASLFPTFLYSQKDFARGAIFVIAENAATYGTVLVTLLVGGRAIYLVAAYFLANALSSLYFTLKARQRARNQETDEHLLSFSTHLSVMNVIGAIADKFDSIIIFSVLGPAQLATYAFALAAPEQIKGVIKNIYGLALPKFAQQEYANIQATIWPKLIYFTIGVAGVVLAYILAAPYLFHWLFPLYTDAIPYTRWFALSLIFMPVIQILHAALLAHKKTKELYIVNNLPPAILVVALLVLVPMYGLAGAIASLIVGRFANAATVAWQFNVARHG